MGGGDSKGASHQNLCEFYQVFTAHKNHKHTHSYAHNYTHTQILEYVSETCKCNANRRENSAADKRQLHLRIRIRNLGAVSRSVYAACAWRYIFKF